MIRVDHTCCDLCGTCVALCPPDAIEMEETRLHIVDERCTSCELCIWVCPVEALQLAGMNQREGAGRGL